MEKIKLTKKTRDQIASRIQQMLDASQRVNFLRSKHHFFSQMKNDREYGVFDYTLGSRAVGVHNDMTNKAMVHVSHPTREGAGIKFIEGDIFHFWPNAMIVEHLASNFRFLHKKGDRNDLSKHVFVN